MVYAQIGFGFGKSIFIEYQFDVIEGPNKIAPVQREEALRQRPEGTRRGVHWGLRMAGELKQPPFLGRMAETHPGQ